MADVHARFQTALALENETERKLAVVSLIDALVQRIGWRAIVIGGLAVEFWTDGAYTTADVDLYLPHGRAVDDLLAELGFVKEGRHWVQREYELFIEAPASFPAEDEEAAEIELSSGDKVLALSIEDVVIRSSASIRVRWTSRCRRAGHDASAERRGRSRTPPAARRERTAVECADRARATRPACAQRRTDREL